MSTAGDLIKASLQEIGVLAAGETPDSEQAADGLAALNRMVNQWAAERLQIFAITRATWTITTSPYSVAGTATIPRPNFVEGVAYTDSTITPTIETPLGELTDAAYQGLRLKTLTSTNPTHYHYSKTFPSGTLTLYPIPTSTTLTGVLYAPQPVASFADLTTTVSLPPGYEEMIVCNLAVRLAAQWTRQTDQSLYERAKEAKAIVKRANIRLADLRFPADSLIGNAGGFDIYTGP